MHDRARLVCLALLSSLLAAATSRGAERVVAVTFDDLPAVSPVANDVATLRAMTRKLLDAVGKRRIPAVGFVNEGKLQAQSGGADVAGRTALLQQWVDAGLELGNHAYSHPDLNRMPLEEFQADVIKGEVVTRRLLEAKGRKLRYFRHPFLHVGDTLEKRRAFEAFLAGRGYEVAPVSVDNDEYVYAAVYADALRKGDAAAAKRIGDDYVRYMDEVFTFFEGAAQRTLGREMRHVLLLHANALNADRFGELADALARRGYRFVTLERALEDAAYRQPDSFVGTPGNSWLNHWEVTAGRKPVPTPAAAAWISEAYAARAR
jgi:peptidoglycan/xylan/chitin deacetylase (PgdA/CDA1 family)